MNSSGRDVDHAVDKAGKDKDRLCAFLIGKNTSEKIC